MTITGNASQDGVAIPSGAVTKIAGEDHVFVRDGETYKPRRVSIASMTGTQSVISDGLKAGEIVATSSVAELKAISAE